MTRKWAAHIGALLVWSGCVLPLVAQQPLPISPDSELYSKTVRKVELRGAMTQQTGRLLGRVVQPSGQPLDRTLVRRSVQALYASGFFSDIRVEAEPVSDNLVDLVFVTAPRYFIGSLTIEGAPHTEPSGKQVLAAAKLQLGQAWSPKKMQEAIGRMMSALADEGYYRAEVSFERLEHQETQLVDLHFRVVPGERARVGEVRIEGDPGLADAEVMRIAKLRPGDPVTQKRVTRALERLRKVYQKQNRLEAEVALKERIRREADNTVDFVFEIRRGPEVEIKVQGAHPSSAEIRRLIPVYEENTVDDDLLNEGRRNLRDHMQTRGYFDATVGYSKQDDPAAGRRSIVYQVERGDRHKLVEIAIQGNHYFDDEIIRERMWMHEAAWLLSHGRFSQAILASDLEAIRTLYISNGFAGVQASSKVEQMEGGRLRVVLTIEEGPQTRVASLTVRGNQAVSEEQIRSMISIIEGQPFSEVNVVSDRELLRNFYFNRGFPEATLEIASQAEPTDATRVNVTLDIHEGPRFFFDRVIVSGLRYTRPETVNRQVQIHAGSPLSLSDMLDTQRRLYDLGLFNEVDIGVQNPEGDAHSKNVLIQVEEASRWTFDYGAGFEVQTGAAGAEPQGNLEASPRFSFDVTRINFRGRDHTLVFKSRVGRLQQRGLVSYIAPHWFD
ncbi:MAG TPA: POTRA domain-containing protein, partial [Terriglobales bacterium]|nr:POTRA domain-containing protein [Terriglobales bacterium]